MSKSETVIEIKVNQDKQQHQAQIASAAGEVRRDEAELTKVMDKIEAGIEKLPEWAEMISLETKMEVARKKLNMAITQAPGLNDLKEDAAVVRAQLRNTKSELSNLLIGYIAKYQERSLMVSHEHRRIDVKASIGKAVDKQEILPL